MHCSNNHLESRPRVFKLYNRRRDRASFLTWCLGCKLERGSLPSQSGLSVDTWSAAGLLTARDFPAMAQNVNCSIKSDQDFVADKKISSKDQKLINFHFG